MAAYRGFFMGLRRQTAVLLGAGHAHLYTIQRAALFRREGFELVVVAPGAFWYSGSATGMLGGIYPPEQDQVDVAELVRRGGGRFVQGTAARIEPGRKTVVLEGGETVPYDVLSVNVGSEVKPLAGSEGRAEVYAIKPLERLWELRRDLEARAGALSRVVVVGGGASGGEIALNVRALLDGLGKERSEVVVLAAGERLFEQFAPGVARKAARLLRERRVEVRLNARAERVEGREVVTGAGERVPFDFLVNAAGLQPPGLLRASGLPVDEQGALRVNASLQSVGDPAVYGGGDCVALEGRRLAKVGVYAVRESPVICGNLLASLRGKAGELRRFEPQKSFLLILNLGGRDGLAVWRRWSWHGRLAFRLKDGLDRRFLARSRRLVGMEAAGG